MKLAQLTVPEVVSFRDKLRAKKCSPAMIKRVVGDLGSMLAYAQERGTVAQNVVRSLSRGKKGKHTDRRHKHRLKVGEDIPAPDEIKAIIAKLDGRYRPRLLTAIFAGLRASELRGLKWDDVDLKAVVIHVNSGPTNSTSLAISRANPAIVTFRLGLTCSIPSANGSSGVTTRSRMISSSMRLCASIASRMAA